MLAAAAAEILFWWKRKTWGRGPVVAMGFFAVSLSPALGFFNVYYTVYSFVADHFQYLASIGIIALVVGIAAWRFEERIAAAANDKALVLKRTGTVLGLLLLAVLSGLTW